jgi:hypothetical protein
MARLDMILGPFIAYDDPGAFHRLRGIRQRHVCHR